MTGLPLHLLLEEAQRWMQADPDPVSAAAMGGLIARRDDAALRACFEPALEFGTAGMRGVVGPGPARLNDAVILRLTLALSGAIAQRFSGKPVPPIVVGFDGRPDSRRFAELAVGVIAAAGLPAAFFDAPLPTPVVAFAGLRRGAAATVMMTASHNPPEYNGCKVYGADGIQIVAPFDQEVTRRYQDAGPANAIAVERDAFARRLPGVERLGEEMVAAYAEAVVSSRVCTSAVAPVRIAYSPLHGVGWTIVERVFRRAGHADLHVEPSQRDIDGRFPTVPYPNPEEPATFERALALARRIDAEVVIVNDPDADRVGAALPDGQGGFRILSGNEIGVVLTDFVLGHAADPARMAIVASLVSTPMAARVARDHGACFEQTLTGFKWLWTAMRMLEAERGLSLALCWEEALGYSTHAAVRDKDGIAAGLAIADWVSECKGRGLRPLDQLGELYRKHGAWGSASCNLVRRGPKGAAEIQRMLVGLRQGPPGSLLGRRVTGFTDYSGGAEARPVYRGTAPMVVIEFEGDARIVVRPSGTEPKLKLYADACDPVGAGEDPFAAYERARSTAAHLAEAFASMLQR